MTWYAGLIIKAARSGHIEILFKEVKLESVQRTKLLTNRVFNPWNMRGDATVRAPTTNNFKNRENTNHDEYYSSVELARH